MLARKSPIRDLALTTNGVMLAEQADALHRAGLHRLTVSLDTLRADRFRALARFDFLPQVLSGIEQAIKCFGTVKLDSVIIRGTNDDEPDSAARARATSWRRDSLHRAWMWAAPRNGRTIA